MPQRQEILEQIAKLDPVEFEGLVIDLFFAKMLPHPFWTRGGSHAEDYSSIVATPKVCGGSARLIRTRIPVWTLERMRQLGFTEADILQSFPTLQALDLVQAWAYVAQHRQEIEQEILENEEN
ncbi:DUF433 domain-containing protein [Blastopirellula marina]|uniref:DUF433 domain-containing protein n=1 Tax=Blastopirellula marina DSM 3645 TaxID=314230 RepID=A3ZTY5_9BACT|nr:DUF433 domain-containing protein [Blastopirellula marina]EAQ80045.1 hypothetical protein DSM3645_05465 [Blastopirellula marina DSM 3645]